MELDYELVTVVKGTINGTRFYTEIPHEDEDKDYQLDEDGRHTCLASNAYWAFVTLGHVGIIKDLEFSTVKRYKEL